MPKFQKMLHPEKFNLILYYTVTSFIAIVIISLAVGWIFPRMESEALIKRSEEYAQYFVLHLNYEIYKDFLLPILKRNRLIDLENNRAQLKRLDKVVRENMYGLNIKKLYLYDLEGRVVYSTMPEHIGYTVNRDSNKKLDMAIHGKSASALRLAGTIDSKGAYVDESLLESYFPFYSMEGNGTKKEQIGVLEIYQDMSALRMQMLAAREKAIIMTSSAMSVLFLALFLVVLKASRIINTRTSQLIDARNTLERKVEERTLDIRAAYKKLQETQRKLLQSEKLASIGTLATGLAHEINNPLASVASCAEGLIERLKTIPLRKEQQPGEPYTVDGGNDSSNTPAHGDREIAEEACDTGNNEKQEHLKVLEVFPEYLRIICEETYRCKAIISNLLNFSRQSEPRFERVEIIRILHDTLAIVRHQPQSGERTIRLSISDELCYVIGDAQQLKQVFLNLIINALHAIENGGEVFVSVLQKQSSVQVVFQDSGMGIKPEHLDKIFDPFFTTKPVGEGTGLGLAICYGIIDVHNGKIDVFSEGAGKGTTITVTLPMAG
ncbi:MAG: hypothetical protein HW390_1659 [Candidatus Brocadiaceae bacterium]|nr:hypothetical protein [Candidatus Brocadiaceae bacterium]